MSFTACDAERASPAVDPLRKLWLSRRQQAALIKGHDLFGVLKSLRFGEHLDDYPVIDTMHPNSLDPRCFFGVPAPRILGLDL